MAKRTKQPSKIAQLTNELRTKNASQETINVALNERINMIENLGMVLIEKMKRIDSKLSTKGIDVGKPPTATIDNDIILGAARAVESKGDTTVLQKLYNFMVVSAEKRDKKRQILIAKQKEARKQKLMRLKRSFKMSIRQKITPTAGGILKTMGFGMIAASVASLAWMFKDELKESADKLKSSLTGFKEFLSAQFSSLHKIFIGVKGIFDVIGEQLRESPLIKSVKNSSLAQSFEGGITGIKDYVDKKIDSVIKMVGDIVEPIIQFFGAGWSAKDLADGSFFTGLKGVAGYLLGSKIARFAGTAVGSVIGGPVGAAIGGAMGEYGTKGYIARESFLNIGRGYGELKNRLQYGGDRYDKVKQIIEGMSDEELFNKFGLKYSERMGSISGFHTKDYSSLGGLSGPFKFTKQERQRTLHGVLQDPSEYSKLYDPSLRGGERDTGYYQDKLNLGERSLQPGTMFSWERKSARENAHKIRLDQERDEERKAKLLQFNDEFKIEMEKLLKEGYPNKQFKVLYDASRGFIISDGEKEIIIKDEVAKSILMRMKGNIVSGVKDIWQNDPTLQKLKNAYGDIKKNIKDIETSSTAFKESLSPYMDQAKETATAAIDTAKSTASAVRTEFADDETAPDMVGSTMTLATKALEHTFNLTNEGMKKLQPSLEKLGKLDFEKEAVQSYTDLAGLFGKIQDTYNTYSDPSKIEELRSKFEDATNKLLPTEQTGTNIGPDPSDPMTALMRQTLSDVKSVDVKSVVNNNNGSTKHVNPQLPLVRNTEECIKRSNLCNRSPWDLPFQVR